MKTQILVKFTKHFINGSLKGLTFDETVKASSLEDANEWINFCHTHRDNPVKSIAGPDYTISNSRLVTIDTSDLCDCGHPKDHSYNDNCIPF